MRILSNPAFSRRAVSPAEAISALQVTVQHPAHQFWADDISFPDALRFLKRPLMGHKQIMDAYFVGLAIHKRGRLATTDRGIAGIAPAGLIELIGAH